MKFIKPSGRISGAIAAVLVLAVAAYGAAASSASTVSHKAAKAASSSTYRAPNTGFPAVSMTKVVAPGVPTLAQLAAGTATAPPSTSPPGAKGKSVWWISCDQASPSCSVPAAEAAAGAKILGIKFHVADGKFDAGGAFNTAMETALAAHPNAILLYGVACQLVKGQLEQAKAEHIITMGINTPDCSDSGGPKLFSIHMIANSIYPTMPAFWHAYGALAADYFIDASDGKAKIIDNAGTEPLQEMVDTGFKTAVKKCKTCSIVASASYDSAELTPNGPWITSFDSTFVKTTTANTVYLPFDVFDTLGGAQEIHTSGRKILSGGGQAVSDGMAFVKRGWVTAETTAQSDLWSGYAGIDAVNRALDGKPQVSEGEGFQLIYPGSSSWPSNLNDYAPPINFKADYLKAWNGGKGTK